MIMERPKARLDENVPVFGMFSHQCSVSAEASIDGDFTQKMY